MPNGTETIPSALPFFEFPSKSMPGYQENKESSKSVLCYYSTYYPYSFADIDLLVTEKCRV
jgi:hypothetical protein